MSTRAARRTLVVAVCALALAACGDEEPGPGAAPPQGTAAPGGQSCENVTVPGHEAVELRASGVECDVAMEVAAAAEGRGRAPYESGGFACRPSEAGGGDTNYECTMGPARITFRYGTT